ncbi:spermidine/putrescine ABC transporter ATP-binding protein [Geobacillus sp. 46C-IIa]|uniref:ABC transporter ATP-binding protein n=1 Tax=Geobacillus sp. 46C-IIa TaxID=1963025 RepID=UPI0009C0B229|nr:ABC transporter ATP-binding protein [Geobacillus sp. 46C-IIa]OQP06450.1 spermidine/putrescine ABC transporter ATP-binding protein [Geobacillus sp. 46C-IIa]QNU29623.1 ABC transporter ATP-binding protein [Geobacillus sp. 46C-IIa]
MFLAIDRLSHTYLTKTTAVTALDQVSLSVEKGEFVSFLGSSGCGKTTLLSIIAGLIEPTEGSVCIEGEPLWPREMNAAMARRAAGSDPSTRRVVGYMLQQDYLFPWKTIEENILLGLNITGTLMPETKERALALLAEIGLGGVESYYPSQLSGGMRQRAALVRTLATDPKLLLLDEPFSALDQQTKLKLEELVWKTLKQYEKTAVLVTHDIEEAIAMSDRIFLFSPRPGRLVRTFAIPDELRHCPPFAARQHPAFSALFQSIWEEMEALESV